VNGVCEDGITGNGSLTPCYSGYYGEDCDQRYINYFSFFRCIDSGCVLKCSCSDTSVCVNQSICADNTTTVAENITLSSNNLTFNNFSV